MSLDISLPHLLVAFDKKKGASHIQKCVEER
jgi:hypothetical protein